MPYIITKSNGGPLDDESFVIGMELGEMQTTLRALSSINAEVLIKPLYLHTVGIPQLDLIAMANGFKITADEIEGNPAWSYVVFEQVE